MLSSSLKNILIHAIEAVPIGECPIDELDLKWENLEDVS